MKNKLEIVVATNNEHKVQELRDIFSPYGIVLYSLKDKNIVVDPDENGKNYNENAYIKAHEVSKFTDLPVLSDDSGIEIEALGKDVPGIYSHRFALQNGGQEETNKMLIKNCPNSPATFTCHFVLLNFKGNERLDFEGKMIGKINDKIEGINGFGYDPIFVPSGYEHSVATLKKDEKNKISHRYNACLNLLNFLKENNYI